jgi:hypothetical protein
VIDDRIKQAIVPLSISAEKAFPLSIILHCTAPSRSISGKGTTEQSAPNPAMSRLILGFTGNLEKCCLQVLFIVIHFASRQ